MTHHLGSDICIIPTTMKATAEDTTLLVFNHRYCKNGLPLNFISDRDKLFMSHFWKALFQLSGIKLKMLSGYHPQMDGDESTYQIPSNGLLFLTFYHFPYTAGPPTSTTPMRPSPTIM